MTRYFTKEGLSKLKQELEHLKTAERKEIAKRLKHAASFGDLSENAAYQEAKEAQGFLEGRILELEYLVKSAKIIEKSQTSERVEIGSTVSVNFNCVRSNSLTKEDCVRPKSLTKEDCVRPKSLTKEEGINQKFQIVGSEEADPRNGKISFESPVGEALLGKQIGVEVEIETPSGKIRYKIISIE